MDEKIIYFYRTVDEYGFLSNFYRVPIRINGIEWPTSEHYFQAQKFAGTPYEEEIRQAKSAMDAAHMGRDRSKPLREDWESVKDSIMYDAVLAKFSQNKGVYYKLLATGDATLIEHTAMDTYWADGGDGSGKNRLGEILMEVRKYLNAQLQSR